MELGRSVILTPVPDQEVLVHQQYLMGQQLDQQFHSNNHDQDQQQLVTNETQIQYNPEVVLHSGAGGVASSSSTSVPIASKNISVTGQSESNDNNDDEDNDSDGVGDVNGVDGDDSKQKVKRKRKSNTEIVDRIMVRLAKIDACNDDAYLKLKNGKLSECSVRGLIRSALTKACKPEHIDEFIDYLARAEVDPEMFQNEQFKAKLKARIPKSTVEKNKKKKKRESVKGTVSKKKNNSSEEGIPSKSSQQPVLSKARKLKEIRLKRRIKQMDKMNDRENSEFDSTEIDEEEDSDGDMLVTSINPETNYHMSEERVVKRPVDVRKGVKRQRNVDQSTGDSDSDDDDDDKFHGTEKVKRSPSKRSKRIVGSGGKRTVGKTSFPLAYEKEFSEKDIEQYNKYNFKRAVRESINPYLIKNKLIQTELVHRMREAEKEKWRIRHEEKEQKEREEIGDKNFAERKEKRKKKEKKNKKGGKKTKRATCDSVDEFFPGTFGGGLETIHWATVD